MLSDLFKVFSKRTRLDKPSKRLTESFRQRVFMRCRDQRVDVDFWKEIHTKLAYLHGRPRLSDPNVESQLEDALKFLVSCDDAHFLDFLEYIFQTQTCHHASELVEDINEFFRQDDLPYALTHFVWTKEPDTRYETFKLTSSPRVIRKDSEALHRHAIQPALELLRDSEFSAANREFLEALEDFRKADYGDCLTKCGSAFESVLKIICARHKWPYSETDTASPLLKTVIANSRLESFFEQPLLLVATIRNRLSKSHGAGLSSRDVNEAKAQFAINATAAAILLLVKEAE